MYITGRENFKKNESASTLYTYFFAFFCAFIVFFHVTMAPIENGHIRALGEKSDKITQTTSIQNSINAFTKNFTVSTAFASTDDSSYLDPELSSGAWGNSPLTIDFEPNEMLCKHMYGAAWYSGCRAWLGKTDTDPKGIQTKGFPEGEWIWDSPSRLRFTPSGYWKGSQKYEIDLSALKIPAHVVLSKKLLTYTHIERSALIGEAKVWVDPSQKAEHALSFNMRFTESLEESVRKNLEENAWMKVDKTSSIELSKPKWIWLDDNTRAVANVSILNMPKNNTLVSLNLLDVAGYEIDKYGRWKPSHNNAKEAMKEILVPGTETIFSLERVELEAYQNKSLQMEQHLVFRFSQRVAPEELLKALTVLELPLTRSEENIFPSTWTLNTIGEETREQARSIQPEIVRIAGESGEVLRFRLDTKPDHYILWNIAEGFGPINNKGVKTPLSQNLEGLEFVPSSNPRLELLQTGNVLMPDSNIVMMSEDLDSVRWSAYRIMDSALALPYLTSLNMKLDSEQRNSSSIVARGEIVFNKEKSPLAHASKNTQNSDIQLEIQSNDLDTSSRNTGRLDEKASYTSAPIFSVLESRKIFGEINKYSNNEINKNKDFSDIAQNRDIAEEGNLQVAPALVYLHVEGIKDNYVIVETGRMLMQSNMALVLKHLPNNRLEAYVCDLNTAIALENIHIDVIGYNGIVVASAMTDTTGKAIIPDISHFEEEKQPVALVARKVVQNGGNNAKNFYVHTVTEEQALSQEKEVQQATSQTRIGQEKIHKENEQVIDMLWISLNDYERYIELSQFADISGKQSSVNTLNAFVFAERGIFAPGEMLNFGTLLRANDWKLLPKELPLVAYIYDTSGKKVFEQKFKAGENIHSFSWQIPQSIMTGTYRLTIGTPTTNQKIGMILGSTTVRVESFMPDTLLLKTKIIEFDKTKDLTDKEILQDMSANVLSTKGWLQTSEQADNLALHVQLDTLYGQSAQNRRVVTQMQLNPAHLHFSGYEDYIFQDVTPYFARGVDPISRLLKATQTNETGQAIIPLDFNQWRFGTLQCTLKTEGFEPSGGRAVSEETRFLLSPMPFMLGYKTAEGAENKEFIIKDSVARLKFQAINAKLEGVDPGRLVFSISRYQNVQSLTSDALGRYMYTQTPLETKLSSQEVSLSSNGTLTWSIPTQEVGDYVLTVSILKENNETPHNNEDVNNVDIATDTDNRVDKKGEKRDNTSTSVLTQISYSIVGNDDLRPALKSSWQLPEAHLHIKTDKTHYNAGESAQIMVTAPYNGVALISLERDTVAMHKWVNLSAGTSMHSLDIPNDFSGRAYIQVLMGRAPKSDAIFIQPQSVAVASVIVNTKEKHIPLAICADDSIKSGDTLIARIGNTQAKPIKAIIFAVDEGVLQLTKFQTPDPLKYLLLDRALEVRTAQLFDRFMPDDTKLMNRLSAFGGDGMLLASQRNMLGSFQNPFKRKRELPATWWSKVVDIPEEGLEVEIPIPDYFNGTLRLMVVAHTEEGVGSAQKSVIVKDNQVLMPQVPTSLSLGDSFIGGLSIANTTNESMLLKTSLSLAPESTASDIVIKDFIDTITLAPFEERYIPFQIEIGQEPGVAVLCFETEDATGQKRKRSASISIRPAILPYYSQESFMVNASTHVKSERGLLAYNAQKNVILSSAPLPLLQSSLNYLYNYPYNCVEQSISKAFPLVALTAFTGKIKNTNLNDANSSHTEMEQVLAIMSKNVPALQDEERSKILSNAYNALLRSFNSYYGVSLWEDRSQADVFLTAYVADYVLALKEAGLAIPAGILPQLFTTLERNTHTSPSDIEELRALAYASWVLARAGYVVSGQLELCESAIRRMEHRDSDIYNTLMAAAYSILYMQEEAQKHLQKVVDNKTHAWRKNNIHSYMFDVLAQYGLHTRIIATHFPEEFQKSIAFMQENLLEGLNKPHATLGASMTALALIDILTNSTGTENGVENISVVCEQYQDFMPMLQENRAGESGQNKNAQNEVVEKLKQFYVFSSPQCANFAIHIAEKEKIQSYFAQVEQYGYDKNMPKEVLEEGLRVTQTYSLDEGMPFENTMMQGDVLRVDMKVTLLDSGTLPVAVVSLLPGGFELVLNHENDTNTSQNMSLMRDEDRVIAFVDASRETQTITYHIRAISQGDFTLPTMHGEGLFDRTVQARSLAGRVLVLAPE